VTGNTIDYDLHGVVGIRLVDASASDARAVGSQLGPFRQTLAREPDIVIRFVERILPEQNLRLLGLDEAAFTDHAFLILRSRYYAQARTQIPFVDLGGRCEIVCESGLPAIPLLIATINLTALAKGVLPLHASAFRFDGRGVLVTGWSKGGKTEALLAFAARGARYVGDEWIYIDPASGRMFGLPQPLRLWSWHLSQFPEFRARIGAGPRSRLAAVDTALGMIEGLGSMTPPGSSARRTYERVREVVGRQAHVDVAPEVVFGGLDALEASMDRVFLLALHESPDVVVDEIDARTLGRRMVSSVHYEFAPLRAYYDMFRFAFPGRTNPVIESLDERLEPLAARAFDGRSAHAVHHPYPVRIAALFDAMRPHV
jgi:hypothetical protein